MELPDGTYELKIEDDYKIETITLIKNNNKVAAANQVKTIAFKPQIVLRDTQLNVSLLALNNEKLTISIVDNENNTLSEKKLSGSVNLGQFYDLSQLNPGHYTVQLYKNSKVYNKLITLN